jgi:hypothetical protein
MISPPTFFARPVQTRIGNKHIPYFETSRMAVSKIETFSRQIPGARPKTCVTASASIDSTILACEGAIKVLVLQSYMIAILRQSV